MQATTPTPITDAISRVHASPTMAVVAVAGAGTAAISWLLGVAGASKTVLELGVPYAAAALTEFVGYEPAQFVSEETAAAMARAAYRRAVSLRDGNQPVVGISCTATIATDRAKRGEHRCFVAAWSAGGVSIRSLTFVKGLRDRAGEDAIASKLAISALAECAGVAADLDLRLDASEHVQITRVSYGDPIAALMAGHIDLAVARADGRVSADEPVGGGVLSGSFNPLHGGHEALARAAAVRLGTPVAYELSVANVDKPPLGEDEVRRRVAQFAGKADVALTRAPVFYEKARLLPGCAFVIGADTAVRLVDKRYYGGSHSEMLLALARMREQGCRFLVAGRVDGGAGGAFRTLADVALPDGFEGMFGAIPEAAFRSDVSSTQLRELAGGSG